MDKPIVIFIDCINDYFHPTGKCYSTDYSLLPIKPIQLFAEKEGILSMAISTEHWPLDRESHAQRASFGAQLIEEINHPLLVNLKKPSKSVFYGSPLEHYLTLLEITTLLFIGPNSELAVEEGLKKHYGAFNINQENYLEIMENFPKLDYFEKNA